MASIYHIYLEGISSTHYRTVDAEPNDSSRHFHIDYYPLNTCTDTCRRQVHSILISFVRFINLFSTEGNRRQFYWGTEYLLSISTQERTHKGDSGHFSSSIQEDREVSKHFVKADFSKPSLQVRKWLYIIFTIVIQNVSLILDSSLSIKLIVVRTKSRTKAKVPQCKIKLVPH